jgi:hypothetical protein
MLKFRRQNYSVSKEKQPSLTTTLEGINLVYIGPTMRYNSNKTVPHIDK